MITALALAVYAVVMATLGARVLHRARWPVRCPRLGVVAWQVISVSVLAAVVLVGLVLVLPKEHLSTDIAAFFHACVEAIRQTYGTPDGAAVGLIGGLVLVGVIGRTAFCWVTEMMRVWRQRRRQHEILALLGRHDHRLDALVFEHHEVAAYCLPGRRRRVVLTSAAVRALAADERDAVVAHELAHLRARHDVVLAAAAALHRAFPRIPIFTYAAAHISDLVEMLADDAAARSHSRRIVASALLRLTGTTDPHRAILAGGSSAAMRVKRLVATPNPLGRLRLTAGALVAGAIMALPFGIAAAPAVVVAQPSVCPVGAGEDSIGEPSNHQV